jgi:hypothetical protein
METLECIADVRTVNVDLCPRHRFSPTSILAISPQMLSVIADDNEHRTSRLWINVVSFSLLAELDFDVGLPDDVAGRQAVLASAPLLRTLVIRDPIVEPMSLDLYHQRQLRKLHISMGTESIPQNTDPLALFLDILS